MAEQDLAAAAAAVLSAGRTSAFTRPSPSTATAAALAPLLQPSNAGTAAATMMVAAPSTAPAPAPLEIALFAQLAQLASPQGNVVAAAAIPQQQQHAARPPILEPHRHPATSAPAAPLTGGQVAGPAANAAAAGGRTRSGESRMSTTYASRHQLAEQRRRNRINER